jgi:hypothetical protein
LAKQRLLVGEADDSGRCVCEGCPWCTAKGDGSVCGMTTAQTGTKKCSWCSRGR